MKILYITAPFTDYLADSVFHGLRTHFGDQVIDFPKAEVMYKSEGTTFDPTKAHGRGFTCYHLLDDIPIDRTDIYRKIEKRYFDKIIFSNIHRQYGYFLQFEKFLNNENVIILDGEDTSTLFPFSGKYWRQYNRIFPTIHNKYHYYKREIDKDTFRYRFYKLPPKFIVSLLNLHIDVHTISFSIPEEKISTEKLQKTKDFVRHIVDSEVASNIPNSSVTHVFEEEKEYYLDLQTSKYGITTKRAGWDCIRHYEMAANGTVLLFKNFSEKPKGCAPHGLEVGKNIIEYSGYGDLISKVDKLSADEYESIQHCAFEWIRTKTTENIALDVISRSMVK